MRIIGQPGTGKTTFLQKKVEELTRFYHKDEFCLTSFTRAAAKVLSSRIKGIENIGTLHSLCYNNISKPTIAETKLKLWNEKYPQHYRSENTKKNIDDMALEDSTTTSADQKFAQIEILRAKMTPVDDWPVDLKELFDTWYQWKWDNDLWDFTDMIEHNLMSVDAPPMNPRVLFVDEAQDLTSLEVALVKKWSRTVDISFFAGDGDQCLYSFKGSSPRDFAELDDDVEVLGQSYRVPSEVHKVAERIVKRIRNRESVSYRPRDHKGFVSRESLTYMDNGALIKSIERDLSNNHDVMLLSTCSYMIDKVQASLRKHFIPFHNPYRTRRGDWNPIRKGYTVDSLVRFSEKRIDVESFLLWQKNLKRSCFEKGIKKQLEVVEKDKNSMGLLWNHYVKAEVKDNLGDLNWYHENCLSTKKKSMNYPMRVIQKRSDITPHVIIGTIHSVKGGESDVVYLFPDLSVSARNNLDDSVHRAFYVGATRAREGLRLCSPATRCFYEL